MGSENLRHVYLGWREGWKGRMIYKHLFVENNYEKLMQIKRFLISGAEVYMYMLWRDGWLGENFVANSLCIRVCVCVCVCVLFSLNNK